jgi:hypothetical protein
MVNEIQVVRYVLLMEEITNGQVDLDQNMQIRQLCPSRAQELELHLIRQEMQLEL